MIAVFPGAHFQANCKHKGISQEMDGVSFVMEVSMGFCVRQMVCFSGCSTKWFLKRKMVYIGDGNGKILFKRQMIYLL